MKIFFLVVGCWGLLLGCAHADRQPAAFSQVPTKLSLSDQQIYEKLLSDSLQFYNQYLRHASSGQYYDSLYIGHSKSVNTSSSVAATGMGLIALSLADVVGTEPNAREKALQTLRFVLGMGSINGVPYISKRSIDGWFRHWFEVSTGDDNFLTVVDGFSTIDTAILVAGAQLAANYFSASGKDTNGEIKALADRILFSVDWGTAVADLKKGELFLNFDYKYSKPLGRTKVFNEYVLVACMGRFAENKKKYMGPMTQFWDQHFADPKNTLPHKNFAGHELLTDHPNYYLSSFIMQFSTYLCSSVANSADYNQYFASAQKADQEWFSAMSNKKYMWGLGAGEVRYYDPVIQKIQSYYNADKINDNPHLMVSPHVIAGFLPVHPDGIYDLLDMYKSRECLYDFNNLEILWRCSLLDLKLPIDRVQAIDYSTMFLGLSSYHQGVGLRFFRQYSAGVK